jgi:hypothetical protein
MVSKKRVTRIIEEHNTKLNSLAEGITKLRIDLPKLLFCIRRVTNAVDLQEINRAIPQLERDIFELKQDIDGWLNTIMEGIIEAKLDADSILHEKPLSWETHSKRIHSIVTNQFK